MLAAIIRRLKRDRRGVSNVIVVMLSLVLIVIIVGNVVLWSYQMNQWDLERMQENVTISDVSKITRSTWFTAQTEYKINAGIRVGGTFSDTKTLDGSFETFREVDRLNVDNSFAVDLSAYPLNYAQGFEILIRYNVTDDVERWFLKVFNWTTSSFSSSAFNDTTGHQPVLNSWNDYAINITDNWTDSVSANGTLLIQFSDEGTAVNQTIVGIDFFGVRAIIDGARFRLRNSSPFTVHIVAIWIVNSTRHQRYSTNFFINSGEETVYIRLDILLPEGNFTSKVVTEKGNMSIFP